jgi:hypothetical protein
MHFNAGISTGCIRTYNELIMSSISYSKIENGMQGNKDE